MPVLTEAPRPELRGVILCLILLSGCKPPGQDHDHPHPHPHSDSDSHEDDHGERTKTTVWSEGYEVFYEMTAPIAGVAMPIAFHVTTLATGEPVRTGAFRVGASSPGGATAEEVVPGPQKAGIYVAVLTFTEPGPWELRVRVSGQAESGEPQEILLPAVIVHASQDAVPPAAESPAQDVTLSKEEQWALGLRTALVRREPVISRLRLPAVVQPTPTRRALLHSPVAGRLLPPREGNFPQLGDYVEAGQVVALVEPPLSGSDLLTTILHHHELQVLEAELSVKAAEATAEELRSEHALALAEKALTRVRRLIEVKAKSERELEESEFEAESRRASSQAAKEVKKLYDAALEQLHSHPGHDQTLLSRFPPVEILAPISGWIDRIDATVGEQIEPPEALLTVVDNRQVQVVAQLPEYNALRLESQVDAYVELRSEEDEPTRWPIEKVHNGLEVEADRTIPLVYRANNPDGRLRLGAAVTVLLGTGQSQPVLAVPASAIVDEPGRTVVFVQRGGESFDKRLVQLGARDRDLVEVTEGLAESERVVTHGAVVVRLASMSSGMPAEGHHH